LKNVPSGPKSIDAARTTAPTSMSSTLQELS
jgi:hypothetical protein